ncbi:MAG: hypothetical protein VX529_06545 [Pseudomonadota bacterium]|nr:hypothetical protein [Pseudomonadota bacterium]
MAEAVSAHTAALSVLAGIKRPAGPVDERRVFRSRIIRALTYSGLSGLRELSRDDLKSIVAKYGRYPWVQSEFEMMLDDGTLVRTGGPHGDEELYRLSPEAA